MVKRKLLKLCLAISIICGMLFSSRYWRKDNLSGDNSVLVRHDLTTSKSSPYLMRHGGKLATQRNSFLSDSEAYKKVCPGNDNWRKPVSPELEIFQDKLDQYAYFHRQQLELIRNGSVSPSEVRTLTWSCPDDTYCFGLGDQINRITTAFLLALISDRVFYIYWNPVTMKTMKYLEPHAIRWDQSFWDIERAQSLIDIHETRSTERDKDIIKGSVYSMKYTHLTLTREPQSRVVKTITHLCEGDNKTVQLFHKMGILKNSSRSVEFSIPLDTVISVVIHYLFTFSHQLTDRVDQIQKDVGLTNPYLGIHLRTGFVGSKYEERVRSKKKLITDSDLWKSMLKCSTEKANTLFGPTSLIYLATDSYKVKELAKSLYPSRIVTLNMTLQHVGFANIKELKSKERDLISLAHSYRDSEPSKNSSIKGIGGEIGIWIDFLLLARSHASGHTRSCYSTLASRICLGSKSQLFNIFQCAGIT